MGVLHVAGTLESITETFGLHLVLFGMQNREFCPYSQGAKDAKTLQARANMTMESRRRHYGNYQHMNPSNEGHTYPNDC
jgi:hypothetical protein